ncbi:MAG: hypothetical protein IMHGJWDQ_000880 [Candidatus Fervidibacter sp.]
MQEVTGWEANATLFAACRSGWEAVVVRRLFVPFRLTSKRVELDESYVHRLHRVLRLEAGDKLVLFDPAGEEWIAEIVTYRANLVVLQLVERQVALQEPTVSLTLFQGLPKGEKMDFIVQKATELGVNRIVPMMTRRTVVQLTPDRAKGKRARWERVAIAATEQCGGRQVPEIALPMSFYHAVQEAKDADIWLLFYESAELPLREALAHVSSPRKVAVMVGPEGGFDPGEVTLAQRHGAHLVSLGRRLLRTETAAVVAVALVLYELGALEV